MHKICKLHQCIQRERWPPYAEKGRLKPCPFSVVIECGMLIYLSSALPAVPGGHFGVLYFSLSVAKTVVRTKTHCQLHRKVCKKVKKNRSFLSKRAVFMVDDTGLEPVTSRTSSGLEIKRGLKRLIFQGFPAQLRQFG